MTCVNCGGRGKILVNPCSGCGGSGSIREEFGVNVEFPAGTRIGSVRSLQGQGNWSPSGRRGDIYVRLACKPHKFYAVDGVNLRCVVPVTLDQALFGGQVTVPTPYGKAVLKIPEGTQPGNVLRIRGKGLPGPNEAGDLLVSVLVEIPSVPAESRNGVQEALKASLEYPRVSGYEAYLREISEPDGQE
jgi:molecular chaperone DnaJ